MSNPASSSGQTTASHSPSPSSSRHSPTRNVTSSSSASNPDIGGEQEDVIYELAELELLSQVTRLHREHMHALGVSKTVADTELKDMRRGYSEVACNEAKRTAELELKRAQGTLMEVYCRALDRSPGTQIDSELDKVEDMDNYNETVTLEARAHFTQAAAGQIGVEKSYARGLSEVEENCESPEDIENLKVLGTMRQ
jgi:hypothetical protein